MIKYYFDTSIWIDMLNQIILKEYILQKVKLKRQKDLPSREWFLLETPCMLFCQEITKLS